MSGKGKGKQKASVFNQMLAVPERGEAGYGTMCDRIAHGEETFMRQINDGVVGGQLASNNVRELCEEIALDTRNLPGSVFAALFPLIGSIVG